MVSDEALKKLQEQIAAWPMAQRFVVQQLIEDYSNIRKDLLAYKNTGLTPEKILPKDKADEVALKLMRLADLESLCSYTRLRELAEADKDGRVVVLPCKVGDVVYGFHNGQTILPMVVKWIETNADGWTVAAQYTPMAPKFYKFSDFGKTVFLTHEKAEEALWRGDNA
nr:MAG: hypothetical protein [Bacteriophage sp.]